MKRFAIGVLVFLLTVGLVFPGAAAAGPPGDSDGHPHGGPPGLSSDGPPGQEDKELPPGLEDKGTPPGLEDKGGLPPGLQGREILPPGIRMRFRDALEDREVKEEEIDHIVVSGEESIVVPQEDEDKTITEYSAVAKDKDGEELGEVDAVWSLLDQDGDLTGVKLKEDGTLEVSSDAQEGTEVTVKASYTTEDGEEFTGTLEVELYEPLVESIQF